MHCMAKPIILPLHDLHVPPFSLNDRLSGLLLRVVAF